MIILGLIAALMLSNLLVFGARIVLHPEPADAWMPASQLVTHALTGLPSAAVEALYRVGWWAHIAILLGFLPGARSRNVWAAAFASTMCRRWSSRITPTDRSSIRTLRSVPIEVRSRLPASTH